MTCVTLHQIKYIFTHIQPHPFQTMSTQKVITVPTFKVDVESVLLSLG